MALINGCGSNNGKKVIDLGILAGSSEEDGRTVFRVCDHYQDYQNVTVDNLIVQPKNISAESMSYNRVGSPITYTYDAAHGELTVIASELDPWNFRVQFSGARIVVVI